MGEKTVIQHTRLRCIFCQEETQHHRYDDVAQWTCEHVDDHPTRRDILDARATIRRLREEIAQLKSVIDADRTFTSERLRKLRAELEDILATGNPHKDDNWDRLEQLLERWQKSDQPPPPNEEPNEPGPTQ